MLLYQISAKLHSQSLDDIFVYFMDEGTEAKIALMNLQLRWGTFGGRKGMICDEAINHDFPEDFILLF